VDPAILPQTLGENVDFESILKLVGDASRGRKLFLNTQGVQCKSCHQMGSVGKAVGPSLEDIAKRLDRHAVLESIVRPSARVDAKYASYVIETISGQVISGVLQTRDTNQVVVVDAQGKQTSIPIGEVDFIERQDKSLMPDLQVKDLTAQQVADLVEFIKSAK
jgi:putative heme-binding domain-containing protein